MTQIRASPSPWQLPSDALQFGLKSRGWEKKTSRASKNPPPSHVQEVPGRFHQAGTEASVQTQDSECASIKPRNIDGYSCLFAMLNAPTTTTTTSSSSSSTGTGTGTTHADDDDDVVTVLGDSDDGDEASATSSHHVVAAV